MPLLLFSGVRSVDLVNVEEFRKALHSGGEAFRRRLFHPSEVSGASVERLASIFAIKEAAFKALALPQGNWHIIEVGHTRDGEPYLTFAPEYDAGRIANCDVSVSHSRDHVVACVVALVGR